MGVQMSSYYILFPESNNIQVDLLLYGYNSKYFYTGNKWTYFEEML